MRGLRDVFWIFYLKCGVTAGWLAGFVVATCHVYTWTIKGKVKYGSLNVIFHAIQLNVAFESGFG